MSPEDKQLIRQFRAELDALAKKSQVIVKKGIEIRFNINSDQGIVDKFDVRESVNLDDDLPIGRAN